MPDRYRSRTDVRRAIETSSLPILYGDEGTVLRVARTLFCRYGIVSYTLIPPGARRAAPLRRFLSRPYTERIPLSSHLPSLAAETVVRFLSAYASETALPTVVDCSADRTLLSDPAICETLGAHAFLSSPETLSETPPFCYLETNEVMP